MRQYEIAIRIAQVHHLAEERKYKKALTVIQTLDMRQVRNISDLKVFAEVYTRTEQFEAAKATYLRIYKKSRTRRILYRLIYLAIRTNELDDAESYYKEFVRMNPNNRDALILRYRIDKAAGVPIGQLIDTLKSLKEEEYIEEWAYELAKLYQQAGRYEECAEECEDIKLWFGQGEIVERAKLLLEHIEEKNPLPFMDDKDFTVKTEQPNPDDTGSLPALNEYLEAGNEQEMKYLKKVDPAKFEETMVKTISEEEQESEPEMDEQSASTEKSAEEESTDIWKPEVPAEPTATEEAQNIFSDAPVDAEPEKTATETETAVQEPKAEQSSTTAQPSDNKYSAINPADFPRISQSGTGITQDLAAEISAIYEAEQNEQLKEKAVAVFQELPNKTNEVFERMTESSAQTPTKEYVPLSSQNKEVTAEETDMAQTNVIPTVDVPESQMFQETVVIPPEAEREPLTEQPAEENVSGSVEQPMNDGVSAGQAQPVGADVMAGSVQPAGADVMAGAVPPEADTVAETVQQFDNVQQPADAVAATFNGQTEQDAAMPAEQETIASEETQIPNGDGDPLPEQQIAGTEQTAEAVLMDELEKEVQQEAAISQSLTGETLPEKDLPTTRALHRSFADILILIGGELDPSHFVLMGDGEERILGISKKIAMVMRETGYLSAGRIARIDAEQLNSMDLMQFKSQLKGNCLLVTRAADLLFPTITKIFSIMDEYYGDFAVILSDEGATLDQLFRFVPALARRFKYIIDISQYTEQDYR